MSAPSLACPRDGTALVAHVRAGEPLHACPRCNGLWVENTRVEAVFAAEADRQAGTPPVARGPWEKVQYLKCARCGGPTARRNYRRVSGVVVDSCLACGVWLDAGELERVGAFLAQGGLQRQATHEAALDAEQAAAARAVDRLGNRGSGEVLSWFEVDD